MSKEYRSRCTVRIDGSYTKTDVFLHYEQIPTIIAGRRLTTWKLVYENENNFLSANIFSRFLYPSNNTSPHETKTKDASNRHVA